MELVAGVGCWCWLVVEVVVDGGEGGWLWWWLAVEVVMVVAGSRSVGCDGWE